MLFHFTVCLPHGIKPGSLIRCGLCCFSLFLFLFPNLLPLLLQGQLTGENNEKKSHLRRTIVEMAHLFIRRYSTNGYYVNTVRYMSMLNPHYKRSILWRQMKDFVVLVQELYAIRFFSDLTFIGHFHYGRTIW